MKGKQMSKLEGKSKKNIVEEESHSEEEMGDSNESTMESVEQGEEGSEEVSMEEESGEGSGSSAGIEEETSSGSSEEQAKDGAAMTVFIKGLSYDLTEYDLKTEMEKIGKVVRVGIPVTNDQKRNKGFGYVEFKHEEDVKKALKLNNTKFLGREVIVNMANPKSAKQRFTMYVSNIPFECDKKKLREFFDELGTIAGMSLPYDKDNDRLRGYGFVDFEDKGEFEAALKKKLVFEDSMLYQKPSNRDGGRGGDDNRMDRKPRYNDFGDRKFKRNDDFKRRDGGDFRRRDGNDFGGRDKKRHDSDAQNRNNKKIKFDSDDE